MNKLGVASILALALVAAFPADAAEGKFPLGFPNTIIQASGHYIVTTDLDGGGQSVIVIEADGVTLDLNGFTLSDATADVITIQGTTAGSELGVTIRNGRIAGGFAGIYSATGASRRILLENLVIEGSGENGVLIQNANEIVVRNCAIRGTAVAGVAVFGAGLFPGQILDNEISQTQSHGLQLDGLAAGIVDNNRLLNTGLGGGATSGIVLDADPAWNAGGTRVSRNTIVGHAGTGAALTITTNVDANIVRENVVRDTTVAGGLQIDSNSTLVIGNVVSLSTGAGLFLGGVTSLADLNQLSTNSNYGLRCAGAGHAYRNNMVTGSLPSGIDAASCVASTDAGGNIP